ncbi:MAG: hypothetical protein HFJ41_04035 [Clostridia bacterium]|nr:hypothetical protein [Clostridia bacterium]
MKELFDELKEKLLNKEITLLELDNIINEYVKKIYNQNTVSLFKKDRCYQAVDLDAMEGYYPYPIYDKCYYKYLRVFFKIIKNIKEEPPEKLLIKVYDLDLLVDKIDDEDIDNEGD